MQWTIVIGRYRPESGEARGATYQTFNVDLPAHASVLDGLIHIREYVDETLAVRCACRSAICGSCAMWINGHANLACKSRLDKFTVNGKVVVETAPSMPIIKDLVWDQSVFWSKHRSVIPWLLPREPLPKHEHIVPNAPMENLIQEVACISCGICLMDCESFAVNPKFIGPHAFAKAYRYADDPRDMATAQRLQLYSQPDGIWDCTHCLECVTQCPKNVAPMDQILKLRRMAVQMGITHNNGTRHADAFASSVRHAGRLGELMLVPKSYGLFNVRSNVAQLRGAWNLLRAGKLLSMLHGAIPGIERIRNIFAKVGGRFGGRACGEIIDSYDRPFHQLLEREAK